MSLTCSSDSCSASKSWRYFLAHTLVSYIDVDFGTSDLFPIAWPMKLPLSQTTPSMRSLVHCESRTAHLTRGMSHTSPCGAYCKRDVLRGGRGQKCGGTNYVVRRATTRTFSMFRFGASKKRDDPPLLDSRSSASHRVVVLYALSLSPSLSLLPPPPLSFSLVILSRVCPLAPKVVVGTHCSCVRALGNLCCCLRRC